MSENLLENELVTALLNYTDGAEAAGKPHWATAMRQAAELLRADAAQAMRENGSSFNELHICGKCNGTGYIA